MLRIGAISTGRQDWGILRTICQLGRNTPNLDLRLFAGGMALSRAHGMTVESMIDDGVTPDERLDWLSVAGSAVHEQTGAAVMMIGDALRRTPVDALVVVGDRFETMAAAIAATVTRVPLIHLHGGEETEGAFDNAIRHAITKLAHLHFVSHAEYARRVIASGEDPSTVHVVGAPGLDNLTRSDLPARQELETRLGIELVAPVVVVTVHPATLAVAPERDVESVCAAMDAVEATYVITLPNNDPGADTIRRTLQRAARRERRLAVDALGERNYWGLLRLADAMLGNSSSALIEAPAVALPAVNVGTRQQGRLRAPNVIDVDSDPTAVCAALRRAVDPEFRAGISAEARSAFGDGHASARILAVLSRWTPPTPPVKRWGGAER